MDDADATGRLQGTRVVDLSESVARPFSMKLVGNVVQMQSGSTAATATLGVLYAAVERGIGQHVDVATFETQNGSLDRRRYYLLSYQYSGATTKRVSTVGGTLVIAGGRFAAGDDR